MTSTKRYRHQLARPRMVAGSLKTLPHVMKYQTMIPQKLKDSSHTNDAVKLQTYPDVIQYSLTIARQNYTLHLERNKDLVGKSFAVTHYSEHGTPITTTPDLEGHCYYHGHVVGVEGSSASVELCSGIKGFVHLQDQMYLIEPLAREGAGQQAHRQSSGAHSEEGLHAVYKYKHLRRKRSSCSLGNTTTFYDHGARSSGLFQLSSLKSSAQTKNYKRKPRTVELAVVVDYTELYRHMGIRVMLVDLEIWSHNDRITVSSNPDQTLKDFLNWRKTELLLRTKHDNAQFITGVDFEGATVGLANIGAMCTSLSGAVNEDHNRNAMGVASTIAHEMGHNLGLSHDTEDCVCGSLIPNKNCIMSATVSSNYPELFSSCSHQQLSKFLEEVNPACLLDTPSTDRIYGGPVCGNAFVEHGEECDCGTECQNPCCNASTCKLNTGAQCAHGDCCHNCQLKPADHVCRPKMGDCDLEDYCTGHSAFCPTDAYTQNGMPCNRGKGYCYNGQCPSRQQHCKRLWGPEAEVAEDACFEILSKKRRDQSCKKLFCSGGNEYPVTSSRSFSVVKNIYTCNEAAIKPGDNYPADLVMVPTGTACGKNMVCYNQQCQDIKNIKEYGTNDCSAKCNNHGVCNHKGECHCDPGWTSPFCDVLSESPKGAGLVLTVSLIVGLLLLVAVVIGSLMYCNRKKQPTKRCHQSTSGQSNPLFQSSTIQGNLRLGSTTISQPTFVESSATQACKPLSSSAVRPPAGAFKPIRTAPEPPKKVPTVPQSSKIHQVVRPLMEPPTVPSKPIYTEARPLPPSKPLPPLASKSIMKPKPPMPPVKPKSSVDSSPLSHTQLLAGRVALMPPSRPR
ncbi:hypothetical protein PAMP_001733 [Pampus punctatissimus]